MKTINLLPKSRQEDIYYESILRSLLSIIRLSVLSFAIVLLVQFAVQFYLAQYSKDIAAQITESQSQVSKQNTSEINTQITALNNTITDYKNLAGASPVWSNVLAAFAPLPPDGVDISSFSVDITGKSVTISGYAPTRDLVIQLYNNILADTKDFYNVDYPLENIVNPTNVNFHFTFYVKDSLLK